MSEPHLFTMLCSMVIVNFLFCSDSVTGKPEEKGVTMSTSDTMFKQVAHVSIKTKDLATSIAYYEKLGFSVVFKFTRNGIDCGAYMQVGAQTYIEIFEDKNLGPVVNNGIIHFCIETDNINTVIAGLTEKQVPFTPKKLGCDNTWQLWLTDPDGNQFEVHQYTAASMQFTVGGSVEVDW